MFLSVMLLKFTSPFFAVACSSVKDIQAKPFLFLPPWWEYFPPSNVKVELDRCVPVVNSPNDILLIGLAILDMLLRIGGFAAVVSIIVSGIQHQFTGGNPEKAAAARRRIWNSFIGLAIIFVAAAVVTFVGNQLGK